MAATKKNAAGESKSDWIRKQPLSMGPTEVVAKAKKEKGWTVDPTYVSKVRPQSGGAKKRSQPGIAAHFAAQESGDKEQRFIKALKAVGLRRAKEIIAVAEQFLS